MSEQSSPPPPTAFRHETQSERRFKYGINVAVAVIAAIVVSAGIVYIVQAHDRRLDTTAAGEFSLKPQTRTVIDDLKSKVTLVSLYTHTKPPVSDQAPAADQTNVAPTDQAQVVADLLDEYKRDGKNIDVEIIDPNTEKDKLAKLHDQLVTNYGNQIQSYRDYLTEWDKQYKQFELLTKQEAAAMTAVTGGQTLDDGDDSNKPASGFRPDLVRTIKALPRSLASVRDDINAERAQKYPDWKKATSGVKDFLQQLSDLSGTLAANFGKLKDEKDVPENIRKYMTESQPRFTEIKTNADALIAGASKLGELKLNQLEDALKVENPILVLGPDDWRVLQQAQVWLDDKAMHDAAGVKIQPRFAGEQQVTAAIYSLTTNSKPKVCFLRPGGPPMTPAGFPPFVPAGLLSEIADRMKLYNFQITEKDLSGTWAAQAQMQQQMPSAPEPSDEEIKDAIWVVIDMGHEFTSGQQEGMPPVQMSPQVKKHLDEGGSALIVFGQQDDDLSSALDSWGIHLHPNTMVVHEAIHLDPGSQPDIVESFKAHPTDFVVKDYGDHVITRAVQSLDSVWVPTMAVTTSAVPDATATSLVPMDNTFPGLKVWGSNSMDTMRETGSPVFDSAKDMAPPIYGMAVSEKKSGGRVVVIGTPLMFNGRINIPDPVIFEKEGRYVSRFPGNGELTADSLFWLAHLDPMIAISPAAMDVSRISPMSHGTLVFWRYGVLLILLPCAVIAAGLFVYAGRRD